MTEKRYYYDCPLMAALMAKYFDMRLEERGNPVFAPVNWDEWFCLDDLAEIEPSLRASKDFNGKWYIHPDSLHLIYPQPGDLIQKAFPADVIQYERVFSNAHAEKLKEWISEGMVVEILKRDGKPFIMPEVEEVTE